MRSPASILRDFARARDLAPGKPLALGLLVPFTRRAHVDAVVEAKPDAVVLMAGFAPRSVARFRAAGVYVLHQIGSYEDAERALAHQADALIAQGVEAGGHVLGDQPGESLLGEVLAIARDKPVLRAGGIAGLEDLRQALAQGAGGVVAGTRYLLTHEALAHPGYKQRVLGAQRTLLTTLFGLGWSLKHRVVPNAATARFCDASGGIPSWASVLQRVTEPLIQPVGMLRDPAVILPRTFNLAPIFTPLQPLPGQPDAVIEHAALYAGESAKRIHQLESAVDVTRAFKH
jgi:NAD(P)H-dependent flavin oxidoreductase YrpB (nitropropane dioxygenase family)